MAMNPKVKKRWVEALRSGKYEQGKRRLRSENTFCCLGVLCDLYRIDQGGRADWKYGELGCSFLGQMNELPIEVARWSGLNDTAGDAVFIASIDSGPYDIPDQCLAEHNDEGRTFEQIADAIEKQL